ncbi:hypothetical protein PCANC_12803 [Puccinia coronata f. sp. avenae]|uniref:Uncharacterized protein n=1 Tax=Puccinia coronata f. sp. avenae TaxID=200324 RepID=A0A2N5T4F2_9BASI|nr:hypothetical protein PCANC_12803 [Puccinia coronata f. sp. avenae]
MQLTQLFLTGEKSNHPASPGSSPSSFRKVKIQLIQLHSTIKFGPPSSPWQVKTQLTQLCPTIKSSSP